MPAEFLIFGATLAGVALVHRQALPIAIAGLAFVTTMLAPLMTPLWMKILAGTLVQISFLNMMTEIIKIVIVPIAVKMMGVG